MCNSKINVIFIKMEKSKFMNNNTLDFNKKNNAKPFLKWAGGKTQLLKDLESYNYYIQGK